ncbi:hypothetical protein HYC85_015228 [Camellia sinensis]|uniref:NB-ARC domain-containing protein n=1 Tax=Camellia sinensis TaxID=4442 RepID=A0A7J7GWH9_CAMSI|nr:hypothetical protein HYC85_015228 [Camellia sinensis]
MRESLIDQVQKLETMRDVVQLQVDAARRNVEIVGNDVEEWLTSVDIIREAADRIISDKAEIQKGCLNLKSRYALSRKATKWTQVAVELRRDGKFKKVSCSALPVGIESLSSRSFKEFESRVSTMNEIIETLKNDQISMIGICGMLGMGKEVAKKVKEDNLFDEIVMSVVSQKAELSKIQRDIAEMLDLQLEEQNPIVRAGRLCKRLENNKKILVILDDVWAEFNVEALGFPLGGGSKGFKILFISRNRYLWSRVQTKIDISLDVLHEEEAWNLLRDKVGNSATTPDPQPISKEIVEECGRLPLALDEEAKSLLLLCCLFEENYYIPIEDLARYGMGLRLFEGINELGKARDRKVTLDNFIDTVQGEHVKMPEVVRDVAIAIGSRDKRVLVISVLGKTTHIT